MRTARIIIFGIVILVVIMAANFVFKKSTESPPGKTLGVEKETPSIKEEGADLALATPPITPTPSAFPTYTGRPLNEVRIGEGFSGSEEVIALQRKNLTEHIIETQKNLSNTDAWIGIGSIKKFFNDYEGARDVWEYTGLLFPSNSISFANLGSLYGFYLGDKPKAVSNYRRAVANDPLNPNVYLGLADFYKTVDTINQEKAVAVILEGMENIPDDVNFHLFLAVYYRDIGDNEKAIKYFQRVLELSPGHPGIQEAIEELNKE